MNEKEEVISGVCHATADTIKNISELMSDGKLRFVGKVIATVVEAGCDAYDNFVERDDNKETP